MTNILKILAYIMLTILSHFLICLRFLKQLNKVEIEDNNYEKKKIKVSNMATTVTRVTNQHPKNDKTKNIRHV